jgi:phosphoserine phosphatase
MADTNPIHGICKKVLKVTDAHLDELDEMAESQRSYMSPLKMATQGRTNGAGDYNERVLAKFRELRAVLLAGPSHD